MAYRHGDNLLCFDRGVPKTYYLYFALERPAGILQYTAHRQEIITLMVL